MRSRRCLVWSQLGWTGGVWSTLSDVDLNVLDFMVVGAFLLAWFAAMLVWKLVRFDRREKNFQTSA
jgi:high-affinity nickel permease